MDIKWIKGSVIIEDWLDTSGEEKLEIDEHKIRKWCDDAVSRIVTADVYSERIVLLDVKDYKVVLPNGFVSVCQAGFRATDNCGCGNNESCLREQVIQYTQDTFDGSGCELEINVNCPKCHQVSCDCNSPIVEVDVNRIWETSNPGYYGQGMGHFYKHGGLTQRGLRHGYHPDFVLMKRQSKALFNIPYHINKCLNLNVDCEIEYDIRATGENNLILTVNRKEGEVLLSYVSEFLDEEGYRMIPNEPVVFEAVTSYIEKKLAYIAYRKSRSYQDKAFYDSLNMETNRLIGRAKNELRMPEYDEFFKFVSEHWRRVVPNYKNFNTAGLVNSPKLRYPNQTRNFFS